MPRPLVPIGALAFALAAPSWMSACQPEEETPGAASPSGAAPQEAPARREPTFVDRTKQADYESARALLTEIRRAGTRGVNSEQASALGFKCASLRDAEKKLAGETDPLVARLIADIDRTCGLDLPVATAQIEIMRIEAKRKNDGPAANVKPECLGLRLAMGDVGAPYATNPSVVDLSGKYATYCSDGSR